MIKTNKKGSLVVISGPSGCGKDTVCNKLLDIKDNVWISISCTSRKPREGEIEGKHYYFLSKDDFEKKIKEDYFLEYACYNDCYYGTPKEHIKKHLDNGEDVILIIEVQGALKIKHLIKEALFIFILPPSMKELKERLINRGTETEDKIIKRFETAYKEINELNKYNYVVVNDDINESALKITSILKAEKCRVDRIEEIYLDNIEEKMHETLMNKKFINKDIEI